MNFSKWIARSGIARLGVAGGVLLAMAFGFGMGVGVAPAEISAQGGMLLSDIEQLYADVYNRVSPAVVSIDVDVLENGTYSSYSGGTGFVIDRDGHVVTNMHVIEGGDRIAVNFIDGTITRAEVVGIDPDSDLAVLRVDLPAEQLSPVTFADSNSLTVGQTTLAIGSPFGERWTLTTGIISALERSLTGLSNFRIGAVIQTDAAINPGNSGGPLLNLAGEVIGVNSQIATEIGSNSGIGFAMPSNLVVRVAQELITTGRVNYAYIGIDGVEVNLDVIEIYGLPNNLRGLVLTSVPSSGPAGQAGLRSASNSSVDVITAIDGVPVYNFSSLVAYLAESTRPGQTVNVTVLRSGQTISVPVVLAERP